MNNHNKADGFERRLEVGTLGPEAASVLPHGTFAHASDLQLYLMENFKHAFDIERSVRPG